MSTVMKLDQFIEQLRAVDLPDANDPFTEQYRLTVNGAVTTMLAVAENEEFEEGKLPNLVRHWIESFGRSSYQQLADAVNTSYSHVTGMIVDMAEARALQDVAQQLISFRDYNSFRISMLRTKP